MGSVFDNLTVIQHYNLIGIGDRLQAMCYDNDRFVVDKCTYGGLDQHLIFRIK